MKNLKIYLASSWKNKDNVTELAELLREDGYKVDDFTDESLDRFVFSWKEITKNDLELNAMKMMEDHRAQKAFKQDKERIDWCDVLICILPCGLSAHMELGYAKGTGKKVILYAPGCFEPGKWEVMYGFADLMTEDLLGIEDYLEFIEDNGDLS